MSAIDRMRAAGLHGEAELVEALIRAVRLEREKSARWFGFGGGREAANAAADAKDRTDVAIRNIQGRP